MRPVPSSGPWSSPGVGLFWTGSGPAARHPNSVSGVRSRVEALLSLLQFTGLVSPPAQAPQAAAAPTAALSEHGSN